MKLSLICFSLGLMSEFSTKPTGLGDLGSGAGQGGGDGGTIRSAGGSFGKREAALEGEYFRKLVRKNHNPLTLILQMWDFSMCLRFDSAFEISGGFQSTQV